MQDIPKSWLISVNPNIVTTLRIMKYPEKRKKNIEFFIVLGLDGEEVFLSGLLSALAIHIHGSGAKPPPPKRQSAEAFDNLPTSINDSALKLLSCLKR